MCKTVNEALHVLECWSCIAVASLRACSESYGRSLDTMASHRPDCNGEGCDEDELVAACQDVIQGIQDGEISKEDVKKAQTEVRQVR